MSLTPMLRISDVIAAVVVIHCLSLQHSHVASRQVGIVLVMSDIPVADASAIFFSSIRID